MRFMGSLDDLNLNLGMGLSMVPEQSVPARYASLDGIGEITPSFKKGFFVGVATAIIGVIVLKKVLYK